MKRNADDITELTSSTAEGVELKITPEKMLMRLADGIAIILENGKVAFINPSGAAILGRPAADIIGLPLQHTVSPGPPTEMEVHGTQGETTLVEVHTEEIGWEGDTAYLCSLRDISQRKQAERTMQRQVQTERMVASLSGLFLNLDPESTIYAIDESLRRLGDFCRVDRCVLFLLSNDLTVFFPYKEWADLGQESPGGMDQSMSVENVPWFWDRLTIFETVLIDTPGSLPSEASTEKDWLAGRSTRSLVAVAVTNGPGPIGFLAFEAVRNDRVWSEDEIGLLKVTGEIIAKAFSHSQEHVEGMAAQKILDALMEGCPSGVLVEDESRKVIHTNGKLSEMFDLFDSHCLVPGMPGLDLLGEISTLFEAPEAFIARTQELVAAASDVTDDRFNLRDGRSVSVTYRSIGVNEQKKRHFWQFSDVTVEDQDEKNLVSYIRRDVLTGFSNRPRLMEDMQLVIMEAAENVEAGVTRFMALLLLDLDDFRSVNTTLGLESGDAVLRQAAERIRNCVQGCDLLGRIGGDGFGILLTSPNNLAEVEYVGRRIVWAIGQPFEVDAHVVQIGVSIGICLYPDQGDKVQTLFQRADMALLQAKEQGKGNLQVFDKGVCRLAE